MTAADDELERAKKLAEEKVKKKLAEKIIKAADEGFLPSHLKNCVWVLRVACGLALFICTPIMGWLYTQWTGGGISQNTFILFLPPMLFLGFISAIVALMKIPTE